MDEKGKKVCKYNEDISTTCVGKGTMEDVFEVGDRWVSTLKTYLDTFFIPLKWISSKPISSLLDRLKIPSHITFCLYSFKSEPRN